MPETCANSPIPPAQAGFVLPPDGSAAYAYAFFLNPAGVAARWRKDSPSCHLNLYFDNELTAEPDASGASGGLLSTSLLNASAPGLKDLVDKLLAEPQFGAAWSAEAANPLGRHLFTKLARSAETTPQRRRFAPAQLARLNDYVHSHLAQRIPVADLAQTVNLEPNRCKLKKRSLSVAVLVDNQASAAEPATRNSPGGTTAPTPSPLETAA